MENKNFRILIDMDDTITNFLEEVINEYNKTYGTSHSIDEVTEWVIPSSFEYGLFSVLELTNILTMITPKLDSIEYINKWIDEGYDVFITADHGNTPCTGLGKYMGAGLEVETKSRRMMVLKDFADKAKVVEKYAMIDYPKYYLSKEYDYLICESGTSLDSKNDEVMSHGGITIDEVVVPFITLKAEDYNG